MKFENFLDYMDNTYDIIEPTLDLIVSTESYGSQGIGCIIAIIEIDTPLSLASSIFVGMSVCGKHDDFNEEIGENIAVGRAIKNCLRVF